MTTMEACFLTSKSITKTVDLLPSLKGMLPPFSKRKFAQILYKNGVGPSSVTSCQLRSSPSDNGGEPTIDSDWRSFRARLVAGEQESRSEKPDTWINPDVADNDRPIMPLGEKWTHPLHEPEKGCLLIATEKLDGIHIFEKTVILLLSTGPIGPTGIILNRPSLMSIKEMKSTDLNVSGTFSDPPLFFGGPLEEGLFLLSPKVGDDGVARSGVFEEVMKSLYYGTKESVGCAAEMVKRNVVGVGDFRFFDGYCGWEKEQLKGEIRAGYWKVVACSRNVIGLTSAGSDGLWDDILGLMGERKVW